MLNPKWTVIDQSSLQPAENKWQCIKQISRSRRMKLGGPLVHHGLKVHFNSKDLFTPYDRQFRTWLIISVYDQNQAHIFCSLNTLIISNNFRFFSKSKSMEWKSNLDRASRIQNIFRKVSDVPLSTKKQNSV